MQVAEQFILTLLLISNTVQLAGNLFQIIVVYPIFPQ